MKKTRFGIFSGKGMFRADLRKTGVALLTLPLISGSVSASGNQGREALAAEAVVALAQAGNNITIKGVVKDAKGETIPAANVVVKGTTMGTVADWDGNFEISVPKGSTLVFSYIGYSPKEVVVAN
ncbi:MAG: carboxypeptidase-like regulatory domain-containing protein, partial [Bacteroidales bacterium]